MTKNATEFWAAVNEVHLAIRDMDADQLRIILGDVQKELTKKIELEQAEVKQAEVKDLMAEMGL